MPFRKCIGCGQIKESSQMIKIMKTHNTREILINPDSNHFGRSSYLCYNKNCGQNTLKKKKLQKTLKTEIPENITEQIKKLTGISN